MLVVKVNRLPDLTSAPESSPGLISRDGPPLAMLEFSTSPVPSFVDVEKMMADVCEVARPLMLRLFADEFKFWFLRVDIERTPEMKRQRPDYALANQLRDAHVLGPEALESVLSALGSERRVGLFSIVEDRLFEACLFMTRNALSIGVLSARAQFPSNETLASAYRAAAFDDDGQRYDWINWRALAASLCPLGDIVVKTRGAFDDPYRMVDLVYDPRVTHL
ncbi:hypothetical protein ACQR1I_30400 [Bradyrhizobium sp. HKCCYLS2038]|uniref:hypothetical protein n=1 Tax=unclassified Bradyrhizobium TaxID=2631580 RepID=UPI003EBDF88B